MSELRSFARLLRSRHLSMLAAYCDESGKHEQATCFVLAGIRANEAVWGRLSREWQFALKELGVPAFHAADCESGYGDFKGLGRQSRDDIQRRLISVANTFSFVAVANAIPRSLHAKAIVPLEGTNVRKYASSPYYFLFHGLIHRIMSHPHAAMKKSRVAFFFDRQDEFKSTAEFLYHVAKSEPGYEHASRMGQIVFSNKTDTEAIPLQLADMFAYEIYKFLTEFIRSKRPGQRMRWQGRLLLRPLFEKRLLEVSEWNEAGVEKLHQGPA